MLSVKSLNLTKGKIPILKEISLEIPEGKTTLLLGKSGSGKTSLLRCLAQLEKEYEGTISYQDTDLKAMDTLKRCQTIGFVPQSYALFPHMDVFDNCAEPLKRTSKKSSSEIATLVKEALTALGMESYSESKPAALSGGQQQRVAIARALLLKPAFLLFDEPTSALDPENTQLFIQILCRLQKEKIGTVISTQDMEFAKTIIERAYFLEQGQCTDTAENGTLLPGTKLSNFLSYAPKSNLSIGTG